MQKVKMVNFIFCFQRSLTHDQSHFIHLSHPIKEGNGNPLQYSCLEELGRLQSMGSRRVRHDWATSLSLFTFMHWRRKCNRLQCSCLENSTDGGAWWAAIYGLAQSRTRLKRRSSSSSSHPIDITCSQDQFWGKTETHDFMNSSVSTWKIVFWFNSETLSIKMMLKLPLLSKSCFLT